MLGALLLLTMVEGYGAATNIKAAMINTASTMYYHAIETISVHSRSAFESILNIVSSTSLEPLIPGGT